MNKKASKKATAAGTKIDAKNATGTVSGEVYAAIVMALHEESADVHDWENTVLTINRVSGIYSPWNSKASMLRENPRR